MLWAWWYRRRVVWLREIRDSLNRVHARVEELHEKVDDLTVLQRDLQQQLADRDIPPAGRRTAAPWPPRSG